MHPYFTRLEILPEVQEYFEPFYSADDSGNLIFPYGDSFEHFGFGFHLVPSTENFWMAGNRNFSQVADIIICGSAFDAIAWLNKKYQSFRSLQSLLFLSVGTGLRPVHTEWISRHINGKRYELLFGRDVPGVITDLKVAAAIRGVALAVYRMGDDGFAVRFRSKSFLFSPDGFSLNAFERVSGFRFNVSCQKPRGFNSFFEELKANAGLLY